jgi:hypothetical protein
MSRVALSCVVLLATTIAHADDNDIPPSSTHWRVAALSGGLLTAGMAGGFVYSIGKLRQTGPAFMTDANGSPVIRPDGKPMVDAGLFSYGGYCQADGRGGYLGTIVDEHGTTRAAPKTVCAHGGLYKTMGVTTGIGMIIGAGFTMFAVYKGYVAKPERVAGAGRRSAPKSLVVTPVMSPDGAGATLRLDW